MNKIIFIAIVFCASLFQASAGDVYAEYKMTGLGDKVFTSKLFAKDGDVRSEVNMNFGGRTMTSAMLQLKSKPGMMIVLNSMNKTYSEMKMNAAESNKNSDYSMEIIGDEKIESYNCTHIRFKSNGKSWDMWVCKDLPNIDFPYDKDDAAGSAKIAALIKSKNIKGMPVKIVFYKTGTSTPTMTMLLTKYESKNLDASLFAIPSDYKKNEIDFDPSKMKNMTPEERKAMIQKMIESQGKH